MALRIILEGLSRYRNGYTVAYIMRILCVYYRLYGCRRTHIRQRRRRRLIGSRRVYRVAWPAGKVTSPRENYLLGSTFLGTRRRARAGWSFADFRRRTLQSASRINSFGQLAGLDAILLFVLSHSSLSLCLDFAVE